MVLRSEDVASFAAVTGDANPVHIGDTITATVRVERIREDEPLVTLATTCANGSGEPVVSGLAVVLVERIADAAAQRAGR
jgi:acyl dehydratase